jgi:hypothetical protein
VATVVVRADGGVATHDILAVYFGGDRDVLANGEAEDSILAGQSKTVAGMDDRLRFSQMGSREDRTRDAAARSENAHSGIGGHSDFLGEGELLPGLGVESGSGSACVGGVMSWRKWKWKARRDRLTWTGKGRVEDGGQDDRRGDKDGRGTRADIGKVDWSLEGGQKVGHVVGAEVGILGVTGQAEENEIGETGDDGEREDGKGDGERDKGGKKSGLQMGRHIEK